MKIFTLRLFAIFVILLAIGVSFSFRERVQKSNQAAVKPNVIVFYADDLGWKELSFSGNTRLKTPNIDALAGEGTRFTQAYSSAPICSPSRAGLVTGRYQQRFGFEYLAPTETSFTPENDSRKLYRKQDGFGSRVRFQEEGVDPEHFSRITKGIPDTELTFAEIFKNNGYATAVIGKWHLGETEGYYPDQHGFDYFFGCLSWGSLFAAEDDATVISRPPYYSDRLPCSREGSYKWIRGREEVKEKQYITDKIADESIQFIEKNKKSPFLLYVPFTAVHDPLQAKKSDFDQMTSVQDTAIRIQLAMTKALDDAIGKIAAHLKKSGLDKNTIIFFSSDNGGPTYYKTVDNSPLKGGKLSHFEGGIRVPYFIKYPGVIPAGKVYDLPVSNLDIFATALGAAGLKVPDSREIDGVNLIPFVNGRNTNRPHEALFWRNGYSKAVRKGDWKLYVNDRNGVKYLYDLAKDPSETTDLAKQNPEKFKELTGELEKWERKVKKPTWPAKNSTLLDVGNEKYFFPI